MSTPLHDESLTLEHIKDHLLSVGVSSDIQKPPEFFMGYDVACNRLYNPPTKEEGIKIAQFMLNEWQQVLNYYQRKE